ncbi:hypothetical protein [Streptomyces bottropensis]|uniref:hypothetical protein n=1 Tax=Streptomyces bottropensis TaxID=42235 RepID=UPI0036D0EED2
MVYGAYENLDAPLTAPLDRQQARASTRLLETIPHAADPRDPAALAADAVGRMSAMLREKPAHLAADPADSGHQPTVVRDRIESDRERCRLRVERGISLALTDGSDTSDRSAPPPSPRRLALTATGTFEPSHLIGQVRLTLGTLRPPAR